MNRSFCSALLDFLERLQTRIYSDDFVINAIDYAQSTSTRTLIEILKPAMTSKICVSHVDGHHNVFIAGLRVQVDETSFDFEHTLSVSTLPSGQGPERNLTS